jgi:molybdopterin molybdotransferase
MTGAPVPAGADAVIMIEHVETGRRTSPAAPAAHSQAGREHRLPGSAGSRGRRVASAGTQFTRANCARRYLRLRCARRFVGRAWPFSPQATSLCPSSPRPAPARFATPMRPCWPLWCRAGGEPWVLPTAADNCAGARRRAGQASEADMLLISGGVSAGKFDLVEPALARMGARFHFTGVRIQPGKPLVFGELPRAKRPSTKTRTHQVPFSAFPAIRSLPRSRSCCLPRRSSVRWPAAARHGPRFALARLLAETGQARQARPDPLSARVLHLRRSRRPASRGRWSHGRARATWPHWPAPTAFWCA